MKWEKSLQALLPAVIGPRPIGLYSDPGELCETLELFLLSTNAHLNTPAEFSGVIKRINNEFAGRGLDACLDESYLRERWKSLYSKQNIGQFDRKMREHIITRDENRCSYCGYTKNLEAHHVIPQKLNGPNNPINLVACCKDCNIDIGATIRIPKNWWILHPNSRNRPSK